jgi:Phytanoyl-CoA dioxygenase (PhyH)
MFLHESLARDGFALVADVLPPAAVTDLILAVGAVQCTDSAREKNQHRYAMRNLLALVPSVRALADSAALRSLVEPELGPGVRPVRGLLFDKTPGANWKVAWHQDLSIAVRRRIDVPGFGPWSIKAGVQHVQPPVEVLANMLTVRLQLDDCGPDNGPLKVLPGSHAAEVLSPERVRHWQECVPPAICCVPAGGALLMRPLILHASSPATVPRHRRVIHLEYAAGELPGGLGWAEG